MTSNLRALLVHISDLHFGENLEKSKKSRKFKKKILNFIFKDIGSRFLALDPHDINLCDELAIFIAELSEKRKPDFLIASGDLTTLGDEESFKEVKDFLIRPWSLERPGLGFNSDTLIVVPGNHDTIINKYYERKNNSLEYYHKVFSKDLPFAKYVPLNDLSITFFTFNSTSEKMLYFSDGQIGENSMRWFRNKTRDLKNEHDQDYINSIKIVIFHHHPIPLPGATPSIWTQLIDGSKFLPLLQEEGIHLVLHGHEHFTATSKIEYVYADNGRHPITICAAGTATQENEKMNNSFNVYYFHDEGTYLEIWDYDKRRGLFSPNSNKIRLF